MTAKLIIVLSILLLTTVSFGGTRLAKHFEIRERQKDCSVLLSVRQQAISEIGKLRLILREQEELYHSREVALGECSKGAGGRGQASGEEVDLVLAAEQCPDEYDGMLTLEYSIENNESDLAEWQRDLEVLRRSVRYHCGAI